MSEATMSVVVNFRFDGVHSWPECPLDPVSFLRHPHRHEFHVRATKGVTHAERQVEIIMLKRAMQEYCTMWLCGPHTKSCETMALELLQFFSLSSCEVTEDGENGAVVMAP